MTVHLTGLIWFFFTLKLFNGPEKVPPPSQEKSQLVKNLSKTNFLFKTIISGVSTYSSPFPQDAPRSHYKYNTQIKYFTFKSTKWKISEIFSFSVIYFSSFVLNSFTHDVLLNYFSGNYPFIIATFISVLINYLGQKLIVFKNI